MVLENMNPPEVLRQINKIDENWCHEESVEEQNSNKQLHLWRLYQVHFLFNQKIEINHFTSFDTYLQIHDQKSLMDC